MLTPRQSSVLSFIRAFREAHGYLPSIREIAAHFEIQVHAAHGHVLALERKGHIQRASGKGRALALTDTEEEPTQEDGVFRLPLAGLIPAGAPLSVQDWDEELELTPTWFGRGKMVAVRVQGDSMSGDAIADGDLAILKLQQTAASHDIVAVRVAREEVTLKRLRSKGDMMELCPSNPAYPVRQVPASQVEIIGKLVGIIRRT